MSRTPAVRLERGAEAYTPGALARSRRRRHEPERARVRDVPARVAEVRVVERVERLDAELQPHAIDGDRPEQPEIDVPEARTADRVPAGVAEPLRLSRGDVHHRERTAIEVLVAGSDPAG